VILFSRKFREFLGADVHHFRHFNNCDLCYCLTAQYTDPVRVNALLQIDERLPSYMEAFDVVLVDDQSMTVPNAVLRQILYAAETSVATSNCDATTTNQCDTNQPQPSPAV